MMKHTKYFKIIAVLIFSILLANCHSKEKQDLRRTITIYPSSNITHLYYNGIIKPIQESLVISPANGVISKMNFHYGDFVKKGDVLFTIHSPDMEREFREAITNYLRIKQAYLTSKKSMIGTEMLHKDKIISDQEYDSEKGQYQNNTLSYVEASTKLRQFLSYLPSFQEKFLTTETINLQEAVQVLQANMDDLTITAPAAGIVLFPEEKSSDDKQFQIGVEVKKNDSLVTIGNLNGLAITANVTENDINNIKPGRTVMLSFQSDLEMELRGKIISVAKQAKNTDNTSFSTFPVVIQVPSLTPAQIQKIRVGMNAKLDILIEQPPTIKIPITAVTEKDHRFYVNTILDDGKIISKEVITGTTSQYEVTILKGLNKGDRIVTND